MAYCSSEQKFAAFDEPTVEIENEEVTDGELQVSVRVVRPCAGCGQDQAETTLEFNTTFSHECPNERGDTKEDGTEFVFSESLDDRTYEIDGSVEAEPVDEYQQKDRKGKPITNSRYMRHLLGAQITATVKCSRCKETFEVTDQMTEAASGYEDQGSH